VPRTEQEAQQNGGRPEADAGSEGRLHVSAERKFLEDARQKKRNCVEDSVLEGVVSAHAHRAESKAVERRDGQQQQREHRESVEDALPESLAQKLFQRKPIVNEGSLLDPRHDDDRD